MREKEKDKREREREREGRVRHTCRERVLQRHIKNTALHLCV